jgi:hypothetical protein
MEIINYNKNDLRRVLIEFFFNVIKILEDTNKETRQLLQKGVHLITTSCFERKAFKA